jgi:hypothetical protein
MIEAVTAKQQAGKCVKVSDGIGKGVEKSCDGLNRNTILVTCLTGLMKTMKNVS